MAQSPCSHRHSAEAKLFPPTSSSVSTHPPASTSQPMTVHPGEAHRDYLLSHHAQRPVAFAFGIVNLPHHDPTLISPSHSFQSASSIYLEGEGVVSYHDSRPSDLDDAPWHASHLIGGTHLHSLPDTYKLPTAQLHFPTQNITRLRSRALTKLLHVDSNTMTTVATIPGSPPDLTDSRSSKASSYGSPYSHVDETSTEITNFEDIGLEDDNDIGKAAQISPHQPTIPSEVIRNAPYFTARKPTTRELRRTKSRPDELHDNSAFRGSLKRGFTSVSTITLPDPNPRQRSSSPPKRLPRSASSVSFSTPSLAGTSPRNSLGPVRRESWQPRKSAAELEAEYHDSDDELPDDASLWNVPISATTMGSRSARSSAKGSPERPTSQSPQPMPLDHVNSTPESPPGPRRAMTSQVLMRHRLKPRSSTSNLVAAKAASPPMPGALARTGRAKSWNVAMSGLSPEARIISENLERHAESQDATSNEGSHADKWLPPIPHRSSAPGAIQLPPIQRGPLDFMPISKEKEAILSRTRPSWLPPKDPKEEKKHLKQYQQMMAASIEAEKKKQKQSANNDVVKDDTLARLNRIWQYYIEPTTDIVNIDQRVHDLCWRGITPRLRGKVWQRTIGNSLGLSPKAYHMALDRAKEIKRKDTQDLGRQEKNILNSFADIERDAETAFPSMKIFQRKGPLWQELINVCEAHACYRSDVGYVYGVQLISALILLQVSDPAEAFILLENCLNNPVPLAFQNRDTASIQRTYQRVIATLAVKLPRLHDYLFGTPEQGGLGLTGEEVLETMFRTMFSNGLDVDRLCRVWDIWVFEGDRTLIRAAVAILGSLQSQIFDVQGDLHLKRRNVQEMLGWGPFNRTNNGGYWMLDASGNEESFVDEIGFAGKLDYTGR